MVGLEDLEVDKLVQKVWERFLLQIEPHESSTSGFFCGNSTRGLKKCRCIELFKYNHVE